MYSALDLKSLEKSSQDPEVRPGLFQGDIAMTNEVILLEKYFFHN